MARVSHMRVVQESENRKISLQSLLHESVALTQMGQVYPFAECSGQVWPNRRNQHGRRAGQENHSMVFYFW